MLIGTSTHLAWGRGQNGLAAPVVDVYAVYVQSVVFVNDPCILILCMRNKRQGQTRAHMHVRTHTYTAHKYI